MKQGNLIEIMSKALLTEEAKIGVTMRNLREKKLLTTGARGVNAPDMTYLDAARTLLAHIVEGNPGRRAPQHVRQFGALPWANPALADEPEPFSFGQLLPTVNTETFENALAALIQVFAEQSGNSSFKEAGRAMRDGTFQRPICLVEIFEEEQLAHVHLSGMIYQYSAPPMRAIDWTPEQDERFRLGRQNIAFVNQEVIAAIADGFRSAAT